MSTGIKVDMTKFHGSPKMIKYISDLEKQTVQETLEDIQSGKILILDKKLAFAMIMHYQEPIQMGLSMSADPTDDESDTMINALMFLDMVTLKEGKKAYTYLDDDGTRYYIKRKGV